MTWDRFTTTILPILTLLVGYVGSLVTEAARDRRKIAEERRRSRAEFQRTTLIEAQDAILELVTAAMKLAEHMQQSENVGIPWNMFEFTGKAGTSTKEPGYRVSRVYSRIDDDEVRANAKEILRLGGTLHLAPDKYAQSEMQAELVNLYHATVARAGELVRTTYS